MTYPTVRTQTAYHYIVIGSDGYISTDDQDKWDDGTFRTKREADAQRRDWDKEAPDAAPHKVVKMVTVTSPVSAP